MKVEFMLFEFEMNDIRVEGRKRVSFVENRTNDTKTRERESGKSFSH